MSLGTVLAFEAAWWIFVISLEVPTGLITDRWGRKKSLVTGSILGTLGFLVFGFSASPFLLLFAYLIWGLGDTFISGTDSAFLFEKLKNRGEEHRYAQYEGWLNAGALVVIATTTALGPLLLIWTSLAVPFILTSIFGVLLIAVSLSLKEPEDLQDYTTDESYSKGFRSAIGIITTPAVAGIVCLKAIPEMSLAILLLTLPKTLANYGLSTYEFGWWMALIFLLMAGTSIFAGRATKLFSIWQWLGLAGIASAAAFILSTGSSLWLFPLCVLPALFLPVTEPHVHQFLADRTDVANRATTLSVANATMSIVIATSIFGGAWIMDEFGFLTAMRIFASATAVLLVIGFAFWSLDRQNYAR